MSTTFSCIIDTTDSSAPLGVEVWFDHKCIFDLAHVTANTAVSHDFVDDEGAHDLRFIMKNKTDLHTQIDAQGNIVNDACITISDVMFDDIKLGHLFVENTQYQHDFNGSQEMIVEPFYGVMGCNGTVNLEFTSPFYLWLLEHM
jgi:hypothetical protein